MSNMTMQEILAKREAKHKEAENIALAAIQESVHPKALLTLGNATAAQVAKVKNLVRDILNNVPGDLDSYEIKKLKVDVTNYGVVWLTIETGMVGDEGTAASILCRDYRHIKIGKRGGTEVMNAKKKSESQGYFNAVHTLTR